VEGTVEGDGSARRVVRLGEALTEGEEVGEGFGGGEVFAVGDEGYADLMG
jgi:hypothetical protein